MTKKIVSLLLSLITVFSAASLTVYAEDKSMIFISTNGNDGASGSINAPLATISAAKEKAKKINGEVTVYFREGCYTFNDTVRFDSEDKSNVVYKAYNNETVVFTSGIPFSGFEECTVNGVRAFKKSIGKNANFNILFNDKTTLSKTRYPESGYLYVDSVSDSDIEPGDDPNDTYFTGFRGMYVEKCDSLNFKNINDVTIKLLHFWKDETLKINSYDSATGHVTFNKAATMRINKNDRFFLQNVFEMLKKPGQWYLDRTEGILYVIPEATDSPKSYTV